MKRIPSVLIVDDSPDDCYLASYVFGKSGAIDHTWSITEPQQVLDLYAAYDASCIARPGEFPPTIIVLDINMPGMTGFELADELAARIDNAKEVGPILICMVTSSLHESDVERAESHPLVRNYYSKPLTAANVAELVESFGEEASPS